MAKCFRRAGRDQQFLLPVDMREWLPDDHVVWALLEVVDRLDISGLEARYALGGAGRAAYDPRMLLALLIYAYSDGIRSSRQIERLCRTDVAMRVITGMQVPDHTVIARFRQRHQDSVREVFTQVLLVCAGRAGTAGHDRDRRHQDRCERVPACQLPPAVAAAAGRSDRRPGRRARRRRGCRLPGPDALAAAGAAGP
ncbi:MAG TPA: transposase [Streptosporangiaceae bacterium]|nr:transposase [Streptosporangiaceae bacterium]